MKFLYNCLTFALAFLYLIITACSEKPNDKYTDNQSSIQVAVTLEGVPDASYDIEELLVNSDKTVIDFSGKWDGILKYYSNGELAPYTLGIEFMHTDDGWIANSIGPRAEYEQITNVSYTAPLLTYTYTGFMTTLEGEAIPFYAELIVENNKMYGVYSFLISELGGEQIFQRYDVELNKRVQ